MKNDEMLKIVVYKDKQPRVRVYEYGNEVHDITSLTFNAKVIENGIVATKLSLEKNMCYDDSEQTDRLGMVALQKAFEWLLADSNNDTCGHCAFYKEPKEDEEFYCGHRHECAKGIVKYFEQNGKTD